MTAEPAPSVLHLFSGLGGGALGFRRAGFRSVGAIDSCPDACADFRLLVGEEATTADIMAMTPDDLRRVCPESPDVLFTSPPCKGFSGCLPEAKAATDRYKNLNSLALHGVWLAMLAWERKPRMIVLENVPRIMSRGREWLRLLREMLQSYGYAVDESTHDCAAMGGLAQHRRRFLLVARHMDQVPAFIRAPAEKPTRTIADVLGSLPVPDADGGGAGPMHALPKLSALNWVRLALIPAGQDWHALPASVALPKRGGRPNGPYGVERWDGPSHAVLGHAKSRDTWASVADPRLGCEPHRGTYGVHDWNGASKTVRGHHNINNAPAAVADPRGAGRWVVRDGAVSGPPLDIEDKRPTRMQIEASDGTWHRPFTTLELAALQGLPTEAEDGSPLVLTGRSHGAWRQRIGNAVPPQVGEAIGRACAAALAAADTGAWVLSADAIWVRPERGVDGKLAVSTMPA